MFPTNLTLIADGIAKAPARHEDDGRHHNVTARFFVKLGLAIYLLNMHNATCAFSLKLSESSAKPVVEKTLENS